MASWREFCTAAPELAESVQERFSIRRHKTMATLRRDGSPRISGIETQFEDGELHVGVMPASVKGADLKRDPRIAIHSPTEDPPPGNDSGWAGEAKIAGLAEEVVQPRPSDEAGSRFRVEIKEVVLTHLNPAGDRLVVESWHEGRGLSVLSRA